jgi:hypothetical protein
MAMPRSQHGRVRALTTTMLPGPSIVSSLFGEHRAMRLDRASPLQPCVVLSPTRPIRAHYGARSTVDSTSLPSSHALNLSLLVAICAR